MNQRDIAHAELKHALEALEDGTGHDNWGPGVVGYHLWHRKGTVPEAQYAAVAFDTATSAIFRMVKSNSATIALDATEKARFIAAMPLVAPALLDVLLDSELKDPE
jgi:hypothetical protein